MEGRGTSHNVNVWQYNTIQIETSCLYSCKYITNYISSFTKLIIIVVQPQLHKCLTVSLGNWMERLKKLQQWWVSVARQLRAWPVAQCWSSSRPPSADGNLGWVAQAHKTLSCLYNLLYVNFRTLALRRHIHREVSIPTCTWVTNNLVVLLVIQKSPAFCGTWRSIAM